MEDFTAGVFLVDKPAGKTSFQVVARLRRLLGMKKVGHAGTLDPFATGLLIVCAGRSATKLIDQFMGGDKEYLANLQLGVETETLDPEGRITAMAPVPRLLPHQIVECLAKFRGPQLQAPPAYSAVKHQGKPLYYYARKGIEVSKPPRPIVIKELVQTSPDELVAAESPNLGLRVICSKGTYIRTLAADIGRELGCGGHLTSLRRLRSGAFTVDGALSWDELQGEDAIANCRKKMITLEEVGKILQ